MRQFHTWEGTRKFWEMVLWRFAVVVSLAAAWIMMMSGSLVGSERELQSRVEGVSALATGPPADRAAALTERLVAAARETVVTSPKSPAERRVTLDETPREPAMVEDAASVLDLRLFPVMKGAEVSTGAGLGRLNYAISGGIQTAFEFQRRLLQELGWRELPGAYLDATIASANFTRDGFLIAVSISDISDDPKKAGWSRVSLINHGNILAGTLPVPADVKPYYPDVLEGSYLTEATVPETVEVCRCLLLDDGWESYGMGSNDPDWPVLYFKQNAIKLTAMFSTTPAAGGQTLIRYSTELLSADLPVPSNAPDPRYNDGDQTLRFESTDEAAETVFAFYQERLSTQGWESTTEQPAFNEKWKTRCLLFRNSQGDMISLDLTQCRDSSRCLGIVRVKVQHRSAAEVREMQRQMEELAKRRRLELA